VGGSRATRGLRATVEGCKRTGHFDGDERGKLRALREAGRGVQALIDLQANLVLRGCLPEGGLEAPQEDVHAAAAACERGDGDSESRRRHR